MTWRLWRNALPVNKPHDKSIFVPEILRPREWKVKIMQIKEIIKKGMRLVFDLAR